MVYGTDDLLALAKAYAAATGYSLRTVGDKACGNDRIFTRLEQGHGCSLASSERAGDWFRDNWPEGTPWPLGERAA